MVKVKKKNQSKITNKKGVNNQNVIVEIHIGEETKKLKGKVSEEDKQDLLDKLDELEIKYNKLQEDKEIVEKAVKVNVPVSIPPFPSASNNKGEIMEIIMDMKAKLIKAHEKLQKFITENMDKIDLQYKELLFNRDFNIDLTEEEQVEVERAKQREAGSSASAPPPVSAGATAGGGGMSMMPPPQVVLPQIQQEIGGKKGRPFSEIPQDIWDNMNKYLQNQYIPSLFGDGTGGVIFRNANQLKGAMVIYQQGNSPLIIKKAWDRLKNRLSPSNIIQKDLKEEVERLKREEEMTDIRGNPLITPENDPRTPKQQAEEKKLTGSEAEKKVKLRLELRKLDDQETELQNAVDKKKATFNQESDKYEEMKGRGVSEVELKEQFDIREKARKDWTEMLKTQKREVENIERQRRKLREEGQKKRPQLEF